MSRELEENKYGFVETEYTEIEPGVFKFTDPFKVNLFAWADKYRNCLCLCSGVEEGGYTHIYYFVKYEIDNKRLRKYYEGSGLRRFYCNQTDGGA